MKGKKPLLLMSVLGIITLLIILFFSPYFSVTEVIVTSKQQNINTQGIQQFVSPKVKNKNLFFFGQRRLTQQIYDAFGDVSAIRYRRKPFHTLELDILGYPIVAIMKHENIRYYLNENGVLIAYDERNLSLPFFEFALMPTEEEKEADQTREDPMPTEAPESAAGIILERTHGLPSDPENKTPQPPSPPTLLGKQIITPEELKRLLSSIAAVEQQTGLKITYSSYVQVAEELNLKTSQDYWIVMDMGRDLKKQVEKLAKALQVISSIKLERIDLSIEGNKVFYKEK